MKQRRIQPPGLGLRLSPLCGSDDRADDPIVTISFVLELHHAPDQWRGSFAFYTNAIDISRNVFGSNEVPAAAGLSLWRYPFPSLMELN